MIARFLAASLASTLLQSAACAALLFDQSTDTISVAGNTQLSQSATYEAQILFTQSHNGAGLLFNEWQGGAEDKTLGAGVDAVGAYSYPVVGSTFRQDSSGLLKPGRWHHVAYVYDGAEERLYVDGRVVSSRPASGEIQNSDGPAYIGAIPRDGTVAPAFVGYIGAVRISNIPRYLGTDFTPATNLAPDENTQLLYDFSQPPVGDTVLDLSGSGHTGTLGGGNFGGTKPEFVQNPPIETSALLDLQMLAAVTVNGEIGEKYTIQYVTDLALANNAANWTTVATVTLASRSFQYIDTTSAGQAKRFYRAVLAP